MQDLSVILFLVFLEGVLSIDNAVVLALLAKQLPPDQQKKALTYGLIGAYFFRFIAIGLASTLMKLNWIKFVGAAYLLYISIKNLLFKESESEKNNKHKLSTFWKTVLLIELTDIAFAMDSILAAVALSDKYWLVVTGGIIGVTLMRFAATYFIELLKKYPHLEETAYLLVFLIGTKLGIDGFQLEGVDFHSAKNPGFWAFWGLMALALLSGFRKPKHLRINRR